MSIVYTVCILIFVSSLAGDISALHRGTPLYGQPSWWGDGDADDENSFKQENKTSGKKQENSGTGKTSHNPFKHSLFAQNIILIGLFY